jgi:hypothetical protein
MRSSFILASDPWSSLTPTGKDENRELLPGLTGAPYTLSAPSRFDFDGGFEYLYY